MRGAGAETRPRRTSSRATPAATKPTDTHCACVSPRAIGIVAAQELDQEALDAHADQVDAGQHARPPAVAQPPQHDREQAHRQRLVDRRGVHGRVDRDRAVGIRHRPRAVPVLAVVAVTGELAADPADRVGRGERGDDGVGELEVQHAAVARPGDHRERAADQAAVEREPRAAEQRAAVLGEEPQLGADDPADQRGEDHLVREVHRAAELAQAPRDHPARDEERHTEAEAEQLDVQTEEVERGVQEAPRGSSWGTRRSR